MERWSRSCGSGVGGPIGAATEFKNGILVHNWVENSAGSGNILGGVGSPAAVSTTQRHSYTPEGKTGADIATTRPPLTTGEATLTPEQLLRHGEFGADPLQCHATLNELTYGPKRLGEPRVQEYLFQGNKDNDRFVPISTHKLSATTMRAHKMRAEVEDDPYATSSKTAAMQVALPAAELGSGTRAAPVRSSAAHGGLITEANMTQTTKEFTQTADNPFQKMNLRGL